MICKFIYTVECRYNAVQYCTILHKWTEQARMRSEDTPTAHDYPYYWFTLDPKSKRDKVKITNLKNLPKLQIFEFWKKNHTWHTVWNCVIRCANMKWIRRVLLKIQGRHHSAHRRTDGGTDRRTRWNQYNPSQLRWRGAHNYQNWDRISLRSRIHKIKGT